MRDPDPCCPGRTGAPSKVRRLSWAKYRGAWWWKDLRQDGDVWHTQAELGQIDRTRTQAVHAARGVVEAPDVVTAIAAREGDTGVLRGGGLSPMPAADPGQGEDSDADSGEIVVDLAPAVRDADPLVGVAFARVVEGCWFRCRVVEVVEGKFSKVRWYLIRYSDGELEHLSAEEILACLRAMPQVNAGSQKKRRAATPVARRTPRSAAVDSPAGASDDGRVAVPAFGVAFESASSGGILEVSCAEALSPAPPCRGHPSG